RQAQDAAGACNGQEMLHILSSIDMEKLPKQDREQVQGLRNQAGEITKAHNLVLQAQKEFENASTAQDCQSAAAHLSEASSAAGGCDSELIAGLNERANRCRQTAEQRDKEALRAKLE